MTTTERIFWCGIGAALLLFGCWHAMVYLVGFDFLIFIFRITAYALLTLTAAWLIFAFASVPVGIILRFRDGAKERFARRRVIEARAVSIGMDAKARYRQSRFSTASGQHIVAIDNESGRQQQYHALPKAALMQKQIEQPEETAHEFAHLDSTEIFEIIYQATLGEQNCPSLIVAGEKRSGKSTLLEYFTHAYAADIDFVVIDPKQPDPEINWGPTTQVIGQYKNWQQISDEIDHAQEEIKGLTVDPNRRKRIYIFDEWLNLLAVKEKFNGVALGDKIFGFMLNILTELSYLGFGVIIGPHATTKTALGFPPGYGELKNNFDGIFRCWYSLFTGKRKAFFESKGEEFEIKLWNPRTARRGGAAAHNLNNAGFSTFNSGRASAPGVPGRIEYQPGKEFKQPEIMRVYESKEEKAVVERKRRGLSNRNICEELRWPIGGRSNNRINAILNKYGVGTDR